LAAQADGSPLDNRSPTSWWQVGQFYYDQRQVALQELPVGEYTLGIKVYQWWDGAILPPAPCNSADCSYWLIAKIKL
jgi:hypothetical protein